MHIRLKTATVKRFSSLPVPIPLGGTAKTKESFTEGEKNIERQCPREMHWREGQGGPFDAVGVGGFIEARVPTVSRL